MVFTKQDAHHNSQNVSFVLYFLQGKKYIVRLNYKKVGYGNFIGCLVAYFFWLYNHYWGQT